MANLTDSLAAVVKSGLPPSKTYEADTLHRVSIDLLDDNPWQPRATMNAKALDELVASIRAQGLIQAIALKPSAAGRFTIVAGHRRVAAFRKLRDEATSAPEKQRWEVIGAVMKPAIDDTQLAAQAYMENVNREELSPIDEARAVETMIERQLARTSEDLAVLLQQPLSRIKRLRRLFKAPSFIKEATSSGLMVVVSQSEAGEDQKELRRLDLQGALAFARLHEHLRKGPQVKKADEKTERAVRRALAGDWSLRRCESYVDSLLEGRAEEVAEPSVEAAPEQSVFTATPTRFSVDLARLASATESQKTALRAAFDSLLSPRSALADIPPKTPRA